MECAELAATGSNTSVLLPVAIAVLAIGVGVWLLARRRGRAGGAALAIGLLAAALTGSVAAPAPASAADTCSTSSPTPTPTPTPSPTPPPVVGVVTANPITVSLWVPSGPCVAGAASCTFTVDVRTLGDATTTPGASVDYGTFTPGAAPAGYTFQYDAATSVFTVTTTVMAAPSPSPTYRVQDSSGVTSNAATIDLPVLPPAPFVVFAPSVGDADLGLPVVWQGAACVSGRGCDATADLTGKVTTTDPAATIDWATLDLDLGTPGVQTTVSPIPSLTVSFDPATHILSIHADVCTVSNPRVTYTVADTAGTVSNVASIWPIAVCN